MKRFQFLLIAWLCASLALTSTLAVVLPVLEFEHEQEHAQLDGQGTTLADAHDPDTHSHDDRAIDVLSHLSELFGVVGALAGAFAPSQSSKLSILPHTVDPLWLAAAPPTGTPDPPDRPPRRLA